MSDVRYEILVVMLGGAMLDGVMLDHACRTGTLRPRLNIYGDERRDAWGSKTAALQMRD